MGRLRTIDLRSDEEKAEAAEIMRRARRLTARLRGFEAISDERADLFIRARQLGLSSYSIAEEVGIHRTQVDHVVKRRQRRLEGTAV